MTTDTTRNTTPPVDIAQWLGPWVSFERLIDGDEPALRQAWRESTAAMRGKLMFRLLMRGDARRFWRWACRTTCRKNRSPIGGWRISAAEDGRQPTEEPLAEGTGSASCSEEPPLGKPTGSAYGQPAFRLAWLGSDGGTLGEYRYLLDHMIDRGLEGKPCYVFHAVDAPEGSPFRVLVAMDPMPERGELARGGLLSHLHFQYGISERAVLRGVGAAARLRHRMWYPTMCADEGTLLDRCNIVRALHQLPAWTELPGESTSSRLPL
ncbi:hypothetical protein [Bifidobacterium leontopitheci]|uniref:ABC transporter ATP-binding protein n=1 Tax=Bifidobacterium leontopitheci TaxID=2650774 RepID=A0A6I1GVY1_9BIFI|nr:hypothetical protein [Bifidobacterium leontopitheci]KAB7790621.1 ABC transporter ATP-binding protein [Bifidobacterium leontopitheci]